MQLKVANPDRDFRKCFKEIKNNKRWRNHKQRDFEPTVKLKILNPDLHICSVEEGYPFELEVLVGKGRGYVSNVKNKETSRQPTNILSIDSIYSPVKKCKLQR